MIDCKRIVTVCLFFLIAVHYVACDGGMDPVDSASLRDPQEENPKLTPQDDADAENMALCLSGELIAPAELYERIHQDLEYIRGHYGSEHDWLNRIHFIAPWVTSEIMILFDLNTGGQVADGTYDAWDSLNVVHEVTGITSYWASGYNWCKLKFSGRRHPKRLSEIYGNLPGVKHAEEISVTYWCYNLFPNISRFRKGSGISYLFGRGEGDCWGGYSFGEFWFFISDGENVRLEGHWNMYEPLPAGEDHIPALNDSELLEKAKLNIADHRNF